MYGVVLLQYYGFHRSGPRTLKFPSIDVDSDTDCDYSTQEYPRKKQHTTFTQHLVWTLLCIEFCAKPYGTCCCEKDAPSNVFRTEGTSFRYKTFSWKTLTTTSFFPSIRLCHEQKTLRWLNAQACASLWCWNHFQWCIILVSTGNSTPMRLLTITLSLLDPGEVPVVRGVKRYS